MHLQRFVDIGKNVIISAEESDGLEKRYWCSSNQQLELHMSEKPFPTKMC